MVAIPSQALNFLREGVETRRRLPKKLPFMVKFYGKGIVQTTHSFACASALSNKEAVKTEVVCNQVVLGSSPSGLAPFFCKEMSMAFICGMVFVSIFSLQPAYAYLDPGSGSFLLQGLLAGIAATGALAGIYWQKLKQWARQLLKADKTPR